EDSDGPERDGADIQEDDPGGDAGADADLSNVGGQRKPRGIFELSKAALEEAAHHQLPDGAMRLEVKHRATEDALKGRDEKCPEQGSEACGKQEPPEVGEQPARDPKMDVFFDSLGKKRSLERVRRAGN